MEGRFRSGGQISRNCLAGDHEAVIISIIFFVDVNTAITVYPINFYVSIESHLTDLRV